MATTKQFNKFKINTIINLVAAIIFSLLLFPVHFDISTLAFPLAVIYTGITVWLTYFVMIKKTDGTHYYKVIKLTEYLPYFLFICFIIRRAGKFGTFYWYDLISVICWFVIFIFSNITSRVLYPKRNAEIVKGWAVVPKQKKYIGLGKLAFEIVDWVDALVWVIFTFFLFQLFFMQLYEIPSESMVPTFLIKDRVVVTKMDCGPKFPLTDVGIPTIRKYNRGDTIVLRNPHYNIDRKSEVKSVYSQLIYMLSIMTVNLNKDENGDLIADPLVKRITGLPGEQLVMQDGILYRRTKNSDVFEPVELDNKFATWNLNAIAPKTKAKVQTFPFTGAQYDKMLDFEESRRNYDLTVASFQADEIVRKFNALSFEDSKNGKFTEPSMVEYELFRNIQTIALKLLSQDGGKEWFQKFMTSWISSKDNNRDIYSEANFKMNVMSKITFGQLVVRIAELYNSNVSVSQWNADKEFSDALQKADLLVWYIHALLDERNMPVFPSNDSYGNPKYIPENCYFMMGDNRFNSLDLRHSSTEFETALSKDDPYSVTYYSMMAPQYINKKYIVGKPVFRFWPLNRLGRV